MHHLVVAVASAAVASEAAQDSRRDINFYCLRDFYEQIKVS